MLLLPASRPPTRDVPRGSATTALPPLVAGQRLASLRRRPNPSRSAHMGKPTGPAMKPSTVQSVLRLHRHPRLVGTALGILESWNRRRMRG